MAEIILEWLKLNWLELFGVVSALLYVAFSIRQIIYLWPLGILSSALYVYIFYDINLYADMSLSIYYVLVSIYGWYYWMYGAASGKSDDLAIQSLRKKDIISLLFITFVLYCLIAWALLELPDRIGIPKAELPFWDAFTTATSIVATWMLTKKYIEQWLIWVIVDIISMAMYLYKGLYPTAILFLIYSIMALIGYIQWKKTFQNKEKQPLSY